MWGRSIGLAAAVTALAVGAAPSEGRLADRPATEWGTAPPLVSLSTLDARRQEPPPPSGGAPPATGQEPEPPGQAPPQSGGAPVAGPPGSRSMTPVRWRRSRAVGLPFRGRLTNGVQLPAEGERFFTWDPIERLSPNRGWRRWGTDDLIASLLDVLDQYAIDHPGAPRVGIGDLSRPRGGYFGARFGGLGHQSHQNGLDADLYYPRYDGLELEATRPWQIDRELSQYLVDLLVEAGAQYVFVGPRTGLRGPPGVVRRLVHHDDHLHVRLRRPTG